MKKAWKRAMAVFLCAVLMCGTLGMAASAVNAEEHSGLPYQYYSYLGDSIPWGYGLDSDIDQHDKYSVGVRVPGSYTDLIGQVLEANNDATVYTAASSGARISDFRYLLERGMEMEDPYEKPIRDWYGERHPERTEKLLTMGPEICEHLKQSDLVTIQAGINDITATIVNSASATGILDLVAIENIEDISGVFDYVLTAVDNVMNDPNVIGNFVNTFMVEATGIKENTEAVVDHVVKVAPDDAQIVLVGYHQAVRNMRVLPGTSYSLVFGLIDLGINMFNTIYRNIAAQYDNVVYVDAPDADTIFEEGTTVVDAVKGGLKNIIKGLHPNATGHEYIAETVLGALDELNAQQEVDETLEVSAYDSYLNLVTSVRMSPLARIRAWNRMVMLSLAGR